MFVLQYLPIFGILLIVKCSNGLDNVEVYVNTEYSYPKCCKQGFHLNSINSTISCIEGEFLKLQLLAKHNESSDNCVDLLLNQARFSLIFFDRKRQEYDKISSSIKTTYPKCCPLGFFYDNVQHKCIFGAERRKLDHVNGLFIASGISCLSSNLAVRDFSYSDESITIDAYLTIQFKNKTINYGNYCFDKNANTGKNIVRVCENYNDVCKSNFEDDGIPCFKKCCPDGQIYINKNCVTTFDSGISLDDPLRIKLSNFSDTGNFGVLQIQEEGLYKPDPSINFTLDEIGNLHIRELSDWKIYKSEDARYCIETERDANSTNQYIYLFFLQKQIGIKTVFLILSVFFISVTLIIYLVLPEMHNVYGNSLMMYFVALILGYGWLAYAQIVPPGSPGLYCVTTGFIILYFMIAYFTWLNVICFHMWLTFGRMKKLNPANRNSETRRFIYYNLYGWGVPAICTLLTFLMYKKKYLPDSVTPHIGEVKCFFDKKDGTYDDLLYFLLPITCLIVANCIFFIKTIQCYFNVRDNINKMNDTISQENTNRANFFNTDRDKLGMLLKLGMVMGVSWLFEVLSTVISFKDGSTLETIETIWDSFNCFNGFFIFCIFILKKRVFKALKNKVIQKKGTESSQSTTTTTSEYSLSSLEHKNDKS